MTKTNDKELLEKLLDDDELQDVELQKKPPMTAVIGVPVKKPYSEKKNGHRNPGGCRRCICRFICITLSILTLLGIFTVGCIYYGMYKLSVEKNSSRKFPAVFKSDIELHNVINRIDYFYNAVIDGENDIEDLVVEQDEINGFITHSDYLRGNVMVTFQEDLIVEEFSLPLYKFGFGDRYFVGNEYLSVKSDEVGDSEGGLIEMKVETEAKNDDWFDGSLFFMQLKYLITKNKMDEGESILELFLEKGSFFGQVVPQEEIDRHEDQMENFLSELDASEFQEVVKLINGIERVSIESGKIVFKARNDGTN